MNRFEKERPGTGGARAAIVHAITTGKLASPWQRFEAFNYFHHELFRALFGIDTPTAYCGDRNARLRRILASIRPLPKPRLP